MSFMPDLTSPIRSPSLFLILAVISFSAAVVWTCTGKAWIRFHGWVYRAQEPKRFWWEVAMDCLIGDLVWSQVEMTLDSVYNAVAQREGGKLAIAVQKDV
jgi:hypothetical protein